MVEAKDNGSGGIRRMVSVYDLESYCYDCGTRDEFLGQCPNCGSKNITTGYGKNTGIFVSTENLADNIRYSANVDSIKNCFKLTAGDDLMTATLVNCNPNGSGYIWHIPESIKEDMSAELAAKLSDYDAKYDFYQNEYYVEFPKEMLELYNLLIDKYSGFSDTIAKIPDSVIGYADAISYHKLTRNRATATAAQIVLGAIQFLGDGGFDYHGTGFIHWAKVWMDDLGDTNARALAAWPHEPVRLEFCGAGRYRLAGNTSQRSNASFIFNNLLWDRGHQMNSENTNSGGWEESGMRQFISNRMMAAMPTVWESMIAKVKINATIGNQSSDIYTSEDYIYIPCYNEMLGTDATTYSDEGDHIEWFTSDAARAKTHGIIVPEDSSYYVGTT